MQGRHNCSPAASITNCVMTLHLQKVHLPTFLSIPMTQKCQILSCDTLVANKRNIPLVRIRGFSWGDTGSFFWRHNRRPKLNVVRRKGLTKAASISSSRVRSCIETRGTQKTSKIHVSDDHLTILIVSNEMTVRFSIQCCPISAWALLYGKLPRFARSSFW